jgi:alpha-D-ribose 1-methylphosphonate 5-triphosphate synthase subunit PhnG
MGQTNGNKLDALRKREAALKAAIAEEQVRQQKRREKDRARLAAIVGEALLEEAARLPDFEALLKQTLRSAESLRRDERARQFLAGMGWLS